MAVFHNQRRRAAHHTMAEGQPVAGPNGKRAAVPVRDQSERVQQLGTHREHTIGARGKLYLPGHQSGGHGRAHGRAHRTRYIPDDKI